MTSRASTLVIGLGNLYRKDDGVGLFVARLIGELAPDHAIMIEGVTDTCALLEKWDGSRDVFIVDCTVSSGQAGRIYRFDALNDEIPVQLFESCSSHAINIVQAVDLARALDRLPRSLTVFGIEGHDFSPGTGMTPDVELGAHFVAQRIVKELNRRTEMNRKREAQNA